MWPNNSILRAEFNETHEQRREREIRNAEIWLGECEKRLEGAKLGLAMARSR